MLPDLTFLPAETKFGQGNIFTSVCHSFCSQGGWSGPGRGGELLQIFWGGLEIFGGGVPPNFRGGPPNFQGWGSPNFWGVPTNFGGGLHRNTVNVRPVRILLECILVWFSLSFIFLLVLTYQYL